MICHHPHLGEGSRGRNTGRGGVNRVRLAGRDGRGAQRDASMADSETTDGGQCRQRWLDQGVGRRRRGRSVPPKRHLLLPRTVQISIACFLHVDDGNVFVVVFILLLLLFVCFVFSSRERPSSSTCCYGFVREGENGAVSLEKRTGVSVGPQYGRAALSCWVPGSSQRCSAGASQSLRFPPCSCYDGTRTFSLYRSPSDLSGCCHQHLGPSPLSLASSQHHDTLEIEFTESHYQY